MSSFQFISLLLLLGGQQGAHLCHRILHDSLRLLHRFLVNGPNLWTCLLDDRLNLRLLLRRQVQGFGEAFEVLAPSPVPAIAMRPASMLP